MNAKERGFMTDRLITPSQLEDIVPLSRTTIWRLEREGKFPKRRKISAGCVGWLASEVEAFIKQLSEVESRARDQAEKGLKSTLPISSLPRPVGNGRN
jgi:prophage regulatory protein